MTYWMHENGLPKRKYALDVGYSSSDWLIQTTKVPTKSVRGSA